MRFEAEHVPTWVAAVNREGIRVRDRDWTGSQRLMLYIVISGHRDSSTGGAKTPCLVYGGAKSGVATRQKALSG